MEEENVEMSLDEWMSFAQALEVRIATQREMIQERDAEIRVLRAAVGANVGAGWKEAAIGWTVCASIHREYAKGRDPLFKTKQGDYIRHADQARAAYAALNIGAEVGAGETLPGKSADTSNV